LSGFGLGLNINMKPIVIWLTGLSGSGKTTVAKALETRLKNENLKVSILDGDAVRNYLIENKGKVYGYSLEERKQFVNNVIYMARNQLEFQKTDVVIVAMISPLQSMRNNARDILTKYCDANFIEVYMDTPLEICEQRDSKGLYKKARAGEIKNFTGIDSIYERSINAEAIIPFNISVEESVDIIYNTIHENTIH
jgi:adenylyl-sulfate kinase